MKGYIYKHTSPSGKSYIGQTTQKDPGMRWRNGRGYLSTTSYGEQTYFARAIKKYGWKNFTHEILWKGEVSSIEELNQLEEDFILSEGTLAPDGYNLKTGGKNHITTEETRGRMKKNHVGNLGKKHSNETKALMSTRQSGKNNPMYGKPVSQETRDKRANSMKAKNKGKHHYTNGVDEVLAYECPEGYWPGSLITKAREHPNVTKKSLTPRRFYNNGQITVRRHQCPPGFVPGKLYTNNGGKQ